MIRVTAPARLHFGLLNPAPAEPWRTIDDEATLQTRRFGGAGLMIDQPSLSLTVERATEWSALGPLAKRALDIARRFAQSTPVTPHAITIERAPPVHSGFGSGTQLGLSLARALASSMGCDQWNASELAERVGRGERSAIGVHGFTTGGFIVEAGKLDDEPLAPLLLREPLPAAWRVVIALPRGEAGRHGGAERASFYRLRGERVARHVEAMARLVLLGMVPALRAGDCRAFGEAVHDYNARAGEMFAAEQGGRYAGSACRETVEFLRALGIAGVGQSSWGPGVFAIVEDDSAASDAKSKIIARFGDQVQAWVAVPSGGAIVTK